MILPNHPRCRLALKILLAVTFPAWALAAAPLVLVGLMGCAFWNAACDIVDGGRGTESFGHGGKRCP